MQAAYGCLMLIPRIQSPSENRLCSATACTAQPVSGTAAVVRRRVREPIRPRVCRTESILRISLSSRTGWVGPGQAVGFHALAPVPGQSYSSKPPSLARVQLYGLFQRPAVAAGQSSSQPGR